METRSSSLSLDRKVETAFEISSGPASYFDWSASHISDAGEILASGKNDGNTVEIEREMTDLTQNQIKYYAVSQAMASRIGILHEIVTRAV